MSITPLQTGKVEELWECAVSGEVIDALADGVTSRPDAEARAAVLTGIVAEIVESVDLALRGHSRRRRTQQPAPGRRRSRSPPPPHAVQPTRPLTSRSSTAARVHRAAPEPGAPC